MTDEPERERPLLGPVGPAAPYVWVPPPPKRTPWWIAWSLGIAAAFALGIAVGSSPHGASAAAAVPAVAVADFSPSQAAPTPEETPTASYTPTVLLQLSGSGIKNTVEFTTVNDAFALGYSYDCSAFGGSGNFIVSLDSGGSEVDTLVNELGAGKSDGTMAYDSAGTYHLSINSECTWSVKVVD